MYQRRVLTVTTMVLALVSCEPTEVTDPGDPERSSVGGIPDAMAVINESEFLVAWRRGDLYHHVGDQATKVTGLPPTRWSDVYGGLLGVSLHPGFDTNRLVYIAYNDAVFNLTVARFELSGNNASNLEILWQSDEFSIGSRIVWQDSAHFFVSFGIGGSPFPDPGPMNLSADVGKIHRLTADGEVPADNPQFTGRPFPTSVWSYGHRNPQGLFYDAVEQKLYAVEHGPMGGDELNLIEKGGHYGWPYFSYGLNYDGSSVSSVTESEAGALTNLPMKAWGPDYRVAPSGLFKIQDPNSAWNGSFLIGSMYQRDLLRYDPATGATDVVMSTIGRVRDIVQLSADTLLMTLDAGSPLSSDVGRVVRVALSDLVP